MLFRSHHYNTRANFKKKMDNLEQEHRELREEVSTLKAGMANLTALMESLVAAQNQPSSVLPQQTRITTEAPTILVFATPAIVQNRMPQGYPWGMPENFSPESFNLGPQDTPIMVLFVDDDVFRPFPPPSEDLGLYDRMDDFQEKFDKMQREMKALRGNSYLAKM